MFDINSVGLLTVEKFEFSFRNEGQIRIPKFVREAAYSLAIDIQIKSVGRNVYQNSRAKPPLGFYGYVTLVYQDALTLEIPITFPRQRVYFEKVDQAFQSWQNEKVFWQNYQFHQRTQAILAGISGVLEVPVPDPLYEFSTFNWKEVLLREVYVKTLGLMDFEILGLYDKPFAYEDPFGNTRDGKSQQEDGTQDQGLPADGIVPTQFPPNNPFGGNPSPIGANNNPDFFLDDGKLGSIFDDGNFPNVPNQTCSVTVVRIDRETADVNGTNSFNNIVVPSDQVFNVLDLPDAESPTGFYSYVILNPSGLYFTGSGFTSSPVIWSEDSITVSAQCVIN